MTVVELGRWALASNWGPAKIAQLDRFLQRFNIVLVDLPLCEKWAEAINGDARAGLPTSASDAWSAATALALNCPLVTHNAADFQGIPGLTIITEKGP